ncbi:MAG TPA: S-layer homology domain-containing protein, partial [Pyrinomonadaceae bacterium]|nr:S-layer homology domain-containing protein [Pyrinomonadaceae bacterium]
YTDVTDFTTRNVVESVQKSPGGKLFFDAADNGAFRPDESATKLIAAVALVKAANLQSLAQTTVLPMNIADYSQIPAQWRGYVAVALQKGFLSLDGNSFAPNRSLKRVELAQAMVKLTRSAIE